MKRKSIGQKIASHLQWLCTICSPLHWRGAGGGLLLWVLVGGGLLCSCGEYWEGGDPVAARKMTLGRRVINLMVGDRYEIPVIFEPDDLSNHSVWWLTEDSEIAVMEENTVVALSEGLTLAYALSVSDRQTDSCWVNVLPPMFINPRQYPYDMVIYADVNIHGHQYTKADEETLIIAAYAGDDLRGIGKMRQWQDKDYMELRIWSPLPYGEELRLRCYYRGQARVEMFPDVLEFDGDAHGSLSSLYPLVLDDSAEEYLPELDPDANDPYHEGNDTIHVIITDPEE